MLPVQKCPEGTIGLIQTTKGNVDKKLPTKGLIPPQFVALAAIPFALNSDTPGILTIYVPVHGFFEDQITGRLNEMSQDISFTFRVIDEEQRRSDAESALRKSEQLYRSLATNIQGIVYRIFLKEENRTEFYNTEVEWLTGYSITELVTGKVKSARLTRSLLTITGRPSSAR